MSAPAIPGNQLSQRRSEERHEDRAEHELRNHGERETSDRDRTVGRSAAAEGGDHPREDADRNAEDEGVDREEQRPLQRWDEVVGDRSPVRVVGAEVAPDRVGQPVRVANRQRPVDAERVVELLDSARVSPRVRARCARGFRAAPAQPGRSSCSAAGARRARGRRGSGRNEASEARAPGGNGDAGGRPASPESIVYLTVTRRRSMSAIPPGT